ncbi:Integral membrane protein [uncultured Candidatus Thioglobus sp.]|nr:Integral membrane protein [uncultured Candidatus Thioglobus sp.]
MDPLTQGTIGAIAATNLTKNKIFIASIFGFLSGMAADLDVFIRSDVDPLLFLEYHRQFTHSLIFIPIGGIICALVFYFLTPKKWQVSFKQSWIFCSAGYATHALLDTCTSYGTQLFWPFSDYRVAWNMISIIDPVFTLPLLAMLIFGIKTKKGVYGKIAILWIVLYMGFAFSQKQRAINASTELALSRGHQVDKIEVKPGFGNLLLWKSIYEFDGKFYVDGIRVVMDVSIYPGTSITKLNPADDFPWLDANTQQAKDIARFSKFTKGFVALHPDNPNIVIDIRYSLVPNQIQPMWMIELDQAKNKTEHIKYRHERKNTESNYALFWRMLQGEGVAGTGI